MSKNLINRIERLLEQHPKLENELNGFLDAFNYEESNINDIDDSVKNINDNNILNSDIEEKLEQINSINNSIPIEMSKEQDSDIRKIHNENDFSKFIKFNENDNVETIKKLREQIVTNADDSEFDDEADFDLNSIYLKIKKSLNNKKRYIPDTSYNGEMIPWPTKKIENFNNNYDEYEHYLEDFYSNYGIINKVDYYNGTSIRKARVKYPHEMVNTNDQEQHLDALYTDPYYEDMLKYYEDKYEHFLNEKELVKEDDDDEFKEIYEEEINIPDSEEIDSLILQTKNKREVTSMFTPVDKWIQKYKEKINLKSI